MYLECWSKSGGTTSHRTKRRPETMRVCKVAEGLGQDLAVWDRSGCVLDTLLCCCSCCTREEGGGEGYLGGGKRRGGELRTENMENGGVRDWEGERERK